MFSLIITITCIALVAALVFAGCAFNKAYRKLDEVSKQLAAADPEVTIAQQVFLPTSQVIKLYKRELVDIAIRNRERRSDRWPQA